MDHNQRVLEYECPCCGAGLHFSSTAQKLKCQFCDNEFDVETVKTFNEENKVAQESTNWERISNDSWTQDEEDALHTFVCQSCGGVLTTDSNTVATFCPYCDNPTILPGRVQGILRPDGVIPFRKSKADAVAAFLNLCKGKPLLPKDFASQQRTEKITGIYVPFWLYDCDAKLDGRYKATRVRHWSDSNYNYTKTDHYLLSRNASACFASIPMDGSSKMDNAVMESIEPFNFTDILDFDSAYLSGYLADKYDVDAQEGTPRVQQRVSETMDSMLQQTFIGYSTVVPVHKSLQVEQGKIRYVLLPVWMLCSRYKDKTYLFAMNGQTGKMTGTFPICPKRSFAWFTGICAAVTAVASIVALFL